MKSSERRVRARHFRQALKPLRRLPPVVALLLVPQALRLQGVHPLQALQAVVVVREVAQPADKVDAVAEAQAVAVPQPEDVAVAVEVIPKSAPQFVARARTRKNLRESRK